MIRLILFAILFYLIYKIGKKIIQFLFPTQTEIKGKPKQKIRTYDTDDIEDIDYEEVEGKNDS